METEEKLYKEPTGLDKAETGEKGHKNSFREKLANKLMVMAMAGFFSMGIAWDKGYADQLKMIRKEGGVAKFSLEAGTTEAKIKSFKERIKREEPKFANWLEDYVKELVKKLKAMHMNIINSEHGEQSEEFLEALAEHEYDEITGLEKDHDIVRLLRSNPEFLSRIDALLDTYLEDMIWGVVYLEDSKEIRSHMVDEVQPVKLTFDYHGNYKSGGGYYAFVEQDEDGTEGSLKSRLHIMPVAFQSKKEELNANLYINVILHELIHLVHILSADHSAYGSAFWMMTEGITQNYTLESLQAYGPREKDLNPIVGLAAYDDRVILAAIFDSIFEGVGSMSLKKWYAGMITDDVFEVDLRKTMDSARLDSKITDALMGFKEDRKEELLDFKKGKEVDIKLSPTLSLLTDVLARLNINGVKLSDTLVDGVLTHGRQFCNKQYSIDASNFADQWSSIAKYKKQKIVSQSKNARH